MSKRFKNDLCAYCSVENAVTGDHIFAREFFIESARACLPKAPTCAKCNNEKSKLEHYLTTVLPFGGRHTDSSKNLALMVPQRLERNAKLHRRILDGNSTVEIPFEVAQLEKLFCFIARGLAWYHWKIYLNDETHTVCAAVIRASLATISDSSARLTGRDHVTEDVGNGTFLYEGLEGLDDPTLTVWRFTVYGGLVMGDGTVPVAFPTEVIAITGPIQSVHQLAAMAQERILVFVKSETDKSGG